MQSNTNPDFESESTTPNLPVLVLTSTGRNRKASSFQIALDALERSRREIQNLTYHLNDILFALTEEMDVVKREIALMELAEANKTNGSQQPPSMLAGHRHSWLVPGFLGLVLIQTTVLLVMAAAVLVHITTKTFIV